MIVQTRLEPREADDKEVVLSPTNSFGRCAACEGRRGRFRTVASNTDIVRSALQRTDVESLSDITLEIRACVPNFISRKAAAS